MDKRSYGKWNIFKATESTEFTRRSFRVVYYATGKNELSVVRNNAVSSLT